MLIHGKGGAGVLVVYREGDRVVAVVLGQGTESIDSRPKKRERKETRGGDGRRVERTREEKRSGEAGWKFV